MGVYDTYIKRILDLLCAFLALGLFWWVYLIIAILVRIKLGKPVLFKQKRPGKIDPIERKEKIFIMYKFRTMTDHRDEDGKLLPDAQRLTPFGKMLRATSLDELPETINILKGDMSIIGPRPQLVRDMVFMTDEQRRRHLVRPGLSGLAQVRGRNAISWEDKLKTDLEYINSISLINDVRIVFQTVIKVLKREGITDGDMATALDYGDYLLQKKAITLDEYHEKQLVAERLLEDF